MRIQAALTGLLLTLSPLAALRAQTAPGVVSLVMQLDVRIPAAAASGTVPITVSVGGINSPNGVTISVQ